MIRGPVLPQMRESLWSLVRTRLDRIETGLTLVLENFDCCEGELGPVDGLGRDAMGGPVLVMLAVEGDALLPARALAAGNFLARVGEAFAVAVPEANYCPGVPGRLLLVGTESAAKAIAQVCRLPIPSLQACALEPFRVAGTERFAVRWLTQPADADAAEKDSAAASAPSPAFVVPPQRRAVWQRLAAICERIDGGVLVHGDRYVRRITWNGHLLGEVRTVGDALVASAVSGMVVDLRSARDVCRFGDQLLRAFAQRAELSIGVRGPSNTDHPGHPGRPAGRREGSDRLAATRHAAGARPGTASGESLRSSLEASRLTPEEYSALGDSAAVAETNGEGSVAEERP
ncbi:MAG TPA: hypothetical protein ENI87_11525 [bacterium]|nr:hypothetical protein [bacterium]